MRLIRPSYQEMWLLCQEVLEEDLEIEECDFDDDFGGNTNVGMQKNEIVAGKMVTASQAAALRR
jgi:hypothetical protein